MSEFGTTEDEREKDFERIPRLRKSYNVSSRYHHVYIDARNVRVTFVTLTIR